MNAMRVRGFIDDDYDDGDGDGNDDSKCHSECFKFRQTNTDGLTNKCLIVCVRPLFASVCSYVCVCVGVLLLTSNICEILLHDMYDAAYA